MKKISYLIAGGGFLLVLIPSIALDVITTQMHHALLDYGHKQNLAIVADRVKADLRDTARFNAFWALSQKQEFLERRDRARKTTYTDMQLLMTNEESGKKTLFSEAEQAIKVLFIAQDRTPAILNVKQSLQVLEPQSMLLDRAFTSLDKIGGLSLPELKAIKSQSRYRERLSDWISRCTEIITAILAITLILLLRRHLILPMRNMAQTIIHYQEGERSARIPVSHVRINDVSRAGFAFNKLADHLNDLEAQRLQFMIGTVHDIRNPLTVLKTASSILQKSGQLDGNHGARKLVRLIDEQVDRMSHLVDDCIDTQQIQSGRFRLEYKDSDIADLVDEAVQLWQVASKGHTLIFKKPEKPVMAQCDHDRMQQALNNLLSNAIKFSPDGGPIKIDIESDDDSVTISVTDKGLGIAADDLVQIFEPFKRTLAVRDFIPGTGLGLSSTKKIIEAHGGSIEVESKVGLGSTFRIRIPRLEYGKKSA